VRIVHLAGGGEVAGGEVVALRLAEGARNQGAQVSFVVPGPGTFATRLREEGFPSEVGDVNRAFRVGGAVRLRRLLAGADLLHTHTLAAANVLARVASPVPVVAHLHIENRFRPATEPLLRRLDSWTARRCARLIAVSEETRRAYLRQGYPERIDVVHNGIEPGPPASGSLRAELGVPDGAPLLGEIGRLCEVKGQRELLQALASVPDARLVLFGEDLERDGAFRAALEEEARGLGVRERVTFAGFRPDAAALLGDLDLVVLPSWAEGLPISVLEAMSRERAVVATRVGGTPELVVDGETGLLVPPRDPEALAAAIGALLADPERRRAMGEAGRRRAEGFSVERMVGRVLQIYEEVLA
jgi:glycosyltransferase involved in cell wall biosynthesis